MNKAKLIAHLTDSSSLFNTSYEELKTLALQYPYNTNFKYLLLSKSRLDNNQEVDRNLQLASTYSIDRAYLRRLMSQNVTAKNADFLLKEEEVLELKDPKMLALDIQQLKGEVIVPPKQTASDDQPPQSASAIPSVGSSPEKPAIAPIKVNRKSSPDVPAVAPDITDKVAKLNREIAALDFSQNNDLDTLSRLTEEINELLKGTSAPVEKKKTVPKKKKGIKRIQSEKKKTPKEKPTIPQTKEKEVEEIATKSVEKKESQASETLAMILVKQGLIDEAIEMYEQLILTFPKKKAFFAAKINSLKK